MRGVQGIGSAGLVVLLVAVLVACYHLWTVPSNLQALQTSPYVPESWPVFLAVNGLAVGLRRLADIISPAPLKVLEDVMGTFKANILHTTLKMRVPQLLQAQGPLNILQLAEIIGVQNPENLQRLLRTAEGMGYFREDLSTGLWYNSR